MHIRTRFAPSPTGYLHLGSMRTALYSYYFAKHHHGQMVLRIEDTDQGRLVEGAVEGLIRALHTFGVDYDEGPVMENGTLVEKGSHGPYTQSKRLPIYQEHVKKLIDTGHAYYCFCSSERLETLRHHQELAKVQSKYDRLCLSLSAEEIKTRLANGEQHVVRLKIPEGKTSFNDLIRGTITVDNAEIDDQVLLKSDGFPTYHLAVVVDDHLMDITHIIRADEWLASTPKHVILYNAFGWEAPVFAHLALILNPDHSKLSKRKGDAAAEDFLKKGYLPEALVNYISLLGFNPKGDQEIYTKQEFIDLFQLEKVNVSGAVFSREKLDWMNGMYLRKMTPEQLYQAVASSLTSDIALTESQRIRICAAEQPRLTNTLDLVPLFGEYSKTTEYDPSILIWKKSTKEEAVARLTAIIPFLESQTDDWYNNRPLIEETITRYSEGEGIQKGSLLFPLRAALSGKAASPGPFDLLWIFGKQESLSRCKVALQKLTS